MTEEEIDKRVKALYKELTSKIKGYKSGNLNPENAEVVNKCLDLYFNLKESIQLTLF